MLKETMEVVILVTLVRVQRQTNEHAVDMPAPHIIKKNFETRGWSHENACNGSTNKLWMCLFRSLMKDIVEEFKIMPQGQFPERIGEQHVDVTQSTS